MHYSESRSLFVFITAFCLLASSAMAGTEPGKTTFLLPAGFAEGFFKDSLRVLEKSGLDYEVVSDLPAPRAIEMVKAGKPVCCIGILRTPDRERIGTYSRVVQQDNPEVPLTKKADYKRLAKHTTYKELLADEAIVAPLPSNNISNGPYLDALYAQRKENYEIVPLGSLDARVKKLVLGRLDWIRVRDFEVDQAKDIARQHGTELVPLSLEDEPEGPKRHFWCAKSVPNSVLAALNPAIERLFPILANNDGGEGAPHRSIATGLIGPVP